VKRHLETAAHLAGRFFGHLGAGAPGPADQQYVHDHLTPSCAAVFWTQSPADQEHAVTVARRVEAEIGDDPATIEAALLHDIGKRDVRIGAIGRSIATVLDAVDVAFTEAAVGAGISTVIVLGALLLVTYAPWPLMG